MPQHVNSRGAKRRASHRHSSPEPNVSRYATRAPRSQRSSGTTCTRIACFIFLSFTVRMTDVLALAEAAERFGVFARVFLVLLLQHAAQKRQCPRACERRDGVVFLVPAMGCKGSPPCGAAGSSPLEPRARRRRPAHHARRRALVKRRCACTRRVSRCTSRSWPSRRTHPWRAGGAGCGDASAAIALVLRMAGMMETSPPRRRVDGRRWELGRARLASRRAAIARRSGSSSANAATSVRPRREACRRGRPLAASQVAASCSARDRRAYSTQCAARGASSRLACTREREVGRWRARALLRTACCRARASSGRRQRTPRASAVDSSARSARADVRGVPRRRPRRCATGYDASLDGVQAEHRRSMWRREDVGLLLSGLPRRHAAKIGPRLRQRGIARAAQALPWPTRRRTCGTGGTRLLTSMVRQVDHVDLLEPGERPGPSRLASPAAPTTARGNPRRQRIARRARTAPTIGSRPSRPRNTPVDVRKARKGAAAVRVAPRGAPARGAHESPALRPRARRPDRAPRSSYAAGNRGRHATRAPPARSARVFPGR